MEQTQNQAYIFENSLRGLKRFEPPDSMISVPSPFFIRLISLWNTNNNHIRIRVTDILDDITSTAVTLTETYDFLYETVEMKDYIELIYVSRGNLEVTIHDIKHVFPAGTAIMINPGTKNSLLHGDCDTISLGLSKSFLKMWPVHLEASIYKKTFLFNHIRKMVDMGKSSEKGFIKFTPVNEDKLKSLLNSIQDELAAKVNGYSLILYGLVFRILMLCQEPDDYTMDYINLEDFTGKRLANSIYSFLIAHPYKLSIKEIAAELNYSEEYLSKIYRKYNSEHIYETNRSIYLEEAEKLLLHTSLSIAKVCSKLHFSDRTSFYKVFKNRYGCTPRQYRLQACKRQT